MVEFNTYRFEHGAMSIIQMGEELIGHPSTAINELVKNAYDADAIRCFVYTHYDKTPANSFLVIRDDGLGMSSETLFGDWLKPSMSSKRDEDREKRRSLVYKRRFLGSKGIGRLAAMALGRSLTVVTRKAGEERFNWIMLDREAFKAEVLLDKITFPGGKIQRYHEIFCNQELLESHRLTPNKSLEGLLSDVEYFGDFMNGTLIVIRGLDSSIRTIIDQEFNYKDIEQTAFFKSLRDLITPLKLNSSIQQELLKQGIIREELNIDDKKGAFEILYGINLIKNNNEKGIRFFPVEPSEILKHYDYRVFGKVADSGVLIDDKYLVDGRYICTRVPSDPRDESFRIDYDFLLSEEERRVRDTEGMDGNEPPKYKDVNVGEFYLDIRVYDLDKESKEKMTDLLRASGKREATQIFSKYLGLKVSKNGFGVKPYGEEEQDWLGLGAKRVQKHQVSIGPNQIIGYVFLYSPQNDALREKTNREGFFENSAFIVFKMILGGILEEMGRRRAAYRLKHNLAGKTKNKFARPDTEKFIQYVLESTDKEDLVNKTRRFVDETNTALDNLEFSLTFSQRLATLGTGLELVYHELSQPITSLGASRRGIEINAKRVREEKLRENILKRVSNVAASIDLLETLKESLKPAIGKSLPALFRPVETFNKVCFLFEQQFTEDGVIIEISKSVEKVEIRDHEYVFWISFLNIINNAAYWLKYTNEKKVIVFEFTKPDTFIISNTGPMIPEDDLEVIFEYGITSKKEKNATGLGLAFTRSMLEMRGWRVSAENRSYGPAFLIQKDDQLAT